MSSVASRGLAWSGRFLNSVCPDCSEKAIRVSGSGGRRDAVSKPDGSTRRKSLALLPPCNLALWLPRRSMTTSSVVRDQLPATASNAALIAGHAGDSQW